MGCGPRGKADRVATESSRPPGRALRSPCRPRRPGRRAAGRRRHWPCRSTPGHLHRYGRPIRQLAAMAAAPDGVRPRLSAIRQPDRRRDRRPIAGGGGGHGRRAGQRHGGGHGPCALGDPARRVSLFHRQRAAVPVHRGPRPAAGPHHRRAALSRPTGGGPECAWAVCRLVPDRHGGRTGAGGSGGICRTAAGVPCHAGFRAGRNAAAAILAVAARRLVGGQGRGHTDSF